MDPDLGIFTQADTLDPLEPGVGTNRYAYALNNPVLFRDPSGNAAGVGHNSRRDDDGISNSAYPEPFTSDVTIFEAGPGSTRDPLRVGGLLLGAAGEIISAVNRSATNSAGQLFENPSQAVNNRIDELLGQIPESSRGRITMGVGVAEDAAGNRIVLVSTSEPNGYLRPGVSLNSGEVLVPGPRGSHAEMDIVRYVQENDLTLVGVGATRPVCTGCQVGIPEGVDIYTPLR